MSRVEEPSSTRNRSDVPRVRVSGYSHPVETDHEFVRSVASEVLNHLGNFSDSELMVNGYTPLRATSRHEGFVALNMKAPDGSRASIGINFGTVRSDGAPMRKGFDAASWAENPYSDGRSYIYVANFDEAWLLLCMIGSQINVYNVKLCYGS